MSAYQLRPMGVGDIFDATFRLYRSHFLTYVMIVLVAYLPYSVVAAFFQMLMMESMQEFQPPEMRGRMTLTDRPIGFGFFAQGNPPPGFQPVQPPDMTAFFTSFAGFMGVTLLFVVIVWPLVQGAMMLNISAGYLGESLSAWDSYRRAAPHVLSLLAQGFLATLAAMVGFCMCVVPGVILALWFMVAPPVVVLEKLGPIKALGRSKELMSGNLGKGFLVMLVIGLIGFIVAFGVGNVLQLVPWPHEFLLHFSNLMVQAVIVPLQLGPIIMLYYDLRIRKEAFDLQRLAADLGQPTVPRAESPGI